jgi:ABC-2 type transport system permease protein
MTSLARHSLRRMLGLRRPLRYKLLPVGFATIAYLPAIAFLGVAALLPTALTGEFLPSPADFYGTILTSLILFTALAGPQALCPDRRHRTLGLYLASPLDRNTYLLANAGALFTVLFVVTLGPPLLIQLGLALLDVPGPALLLLLARVVAAGVALSVLLGMVGLAGASLTDNRGFAAAGVFVSLIGLGVVAGVLNEALDLPGWTEMLNVASLALEAAARLHGEEATIAGVSTPTIALGWSVWVAALTTLVATRYRRLAVIR